MAQQTTLPIERRTEHGTAKVRRLRQSGKIPANLYGQGQEVVSISVATDVITPVVMQGTQVVDVELEGTTEKVIIREVQWDTFLTHLVHLDLQRIDKDSRMDLNVPIELRGTLNEGVLEQLAHTVELNCPVWHIPDRISVRIGALKIGDSVTISDLDLPGDVTPTAEPDSIVLRINEPQDIDIEQEDVGAAVEPEVIGRSEEDGDEAE